MASNSRRVPHITARVEHHKEEVSQQNILAIAR